jgi:hypothetical protein
MSLIDEYKSNSSELHGFTLGYCTFFSQFTLEYNSRFGGSEPNTFCWNKKMLMWHNYGHLVDFVREQLIWIYSEEVQNRVKGGGAGPRTTREECQRRINFFVLKLQEKVGSGWDAHFILRDIRNLAFLCLKT